MMFLKVCGITREKDAAEAARLGFDAIGLVFTESPRRVGPERARAICGSAPAGLLKVGVFVNEDRREVERLAGYCGLDLLQFHGDEDASYVAAFGKRAVKSFAPGPGFEEAALEEYAGCFALLMDAGDPERRGGTGNLADWKTAARMAGRYSLILAGGLTPSRVSPAIRSVKPFGLDVSSGVERQPGIKDPEMMRYFVEAARNASLAMEVGR
jgi:phosphoribosylanthranilate isomerase